MQTAASGMGRVSQPVLALLPAEARAVGASAGLVEGPDGGVVFVFGLATFTYDLPGVFRTGSPVDSRC